MFHKGARMVGGNLPNEITQKINLLMDQFIEIVSKEVKKRKLRSAVVRSMLPCNVVYILDSKTLWVIAQKQTGMPSTHALDCRNQAFPYEEIANAAKWEFGFDHPFIIAFPSEIIDLPPDKRQDIVESIVLSHINAEVERINSEMNIIQINPIFGPATYKIDNRLAFVLMPFTDELTEIYTTVIKPTIENNPFNLVCKRADDIKSNRAIIQDIWKSICEARIIIADLTGLNPNVMYELGIAHTLGKETILLYQRQENEIKFPFDLVHIRRIEYENSVTGGRRLEEDLKQTLENVLSPWVRA